jgi:hypothetical protein
MGQNKSLIATASQTLEEAALSVIARKLTVDPTSIDPLKIKWSTSLCFICCNTYKKKEYQLGEGPLNDSLNVAKNMKKFGYSVVFLHNPTKELFTKWMDFIFQNFKGQLVLFYVGHGASVADKNGDEDDGLDEAMVFENGFLIDDQLKESLSKCGCARTVLLSDCCHSGSIWDLQSVSITRGIKLKGRGILSKTEAKGVNIISISAATDSQTAKQTMMESKDQGVFSFHFWEAVNKNKKITSNQMEDVLANVLGKYQQRYTAAATDPAMLDEPIF